MKKRVVMRRKKTVLRDVAAQKEMNTPVRPPTIPPHPQPNQCRTQDSAIPQSRRKKKPTTISRKGLIHWRILAPRPGLEPGTYGLTEQVTPVLIARKLKICKKFSGGDHL